MNKIMLPSKCSRRSKNKCNLPCKCPRFQTSKTQGPRYLIIYQRHPERNMMMVPGIWWIWVWAFSSINLLRERLNRRTRCGNQRLLLEEILWVMECRDMTNSNRRSKLSKHASNRWRSLNPRTSLKKILPQIINNLRCRLEASSKIWWVKSEERMKWTVRNLVQLFQPLCFSPQLSHRPSKLCLKSVWAAHYHLI